MLSYVGFGVYVATGLVYLGGGLFFVPGPWLVASVGRLARRLVGCLPAHAETVVLGGRSGPGGACRPVGLCVSGLGDVGLGG